MIICKVKFPSNSNAFFQQILSLVTFDIVPEEYYSPLRNWIFDDLPSDYFYHEQVAQAGFETGYIYVSMFFTFILITFFLLSVLLNFLIYNCFKSCKPCKNRVDKSKEKLKEFHGEMIRLFIELCLDIGICGSIEFIMRQVGTD